MPQFQFFWLWMHLLAICWCLLKMCTKQIFVYVFNKTNFEHFEPNFSTSPVSYVEFKATISLLLSLKAIFLTLPHSFSPLLLGPLEFGTPYIWWGQNATWERKGDKNWTLFHSATDRPKDQVSRYVQNNIWVRFHHEGGLSHDCFLELISWNGFFSHSKKSASTETLCQCLKAFQNISHKFSLWNSDKILLALEISKRVPNLTLWVLIVWEGSGYFCQLIKLFKTLGPRGVRDLEVKEDDDQ